jgi:hypothetical protein
VHRQVVMSWPPKRIDPASARSRPVSMLKNVVLPAPFGPIRLCSRKDAPPGDILRHHQRAKRLFRPALQDGLAGPSRRRRRAYGSICAGRGGMPRRVRVQSVAPISRNTSPCMPSGRGQREHDHDRREHQPPAFGDRRQPVFQQNESDGAPQRAEENDARRPAPSSAARRRRAASSDCRRRRRAASAPAMPPASRRRRP